MRLQALTASKIPVWKLSSVEEHLPLIRYLEVLLTVPLIAFMTLEALVKNRLVANIHPEEKSIAGFTPGMPLRARA